MREKQRKKGIASIEMVALIAIAAFIVSGFGMILMKQNGDTGEKANQYIESNMRDELPKIQE